jgi:hypothetical protein
MQESALTSVEGFLAALEFSILFANFICREQSRYDMG